MNIATMQKKQYRFINDPGHGWLEVPIAEIDALGIAGKISGYSYVKNGMAYLEEDQDLGVFVDAWEALHGERLICADVYQEETPIREYRHWPGTF